MTVLDSGSEVVFFDDLVGFFDFSEAVVVEFAYCSGDTTVEGESILGEVGDGGGNRVAFEEVLSGLERFGAVVVVGVDDDELGVIGGFKGGEEGVRGAARFAVRGVLENDLNFYREIGGCFLGLREDFFAGDQEELGASDGHGTMERVMEEALTVGAELEELFWATEAASEASGQNNECHCI